MLSALCSVSQAGQLHKPIALNLARKMEGNWKDMNIYSMFHVLRFFFLHDIELSHKSREEIREALAVYCRPELLNMRFWDLVYMMCT